MVAPLLAFLETTFKGWLGARGFAIVVVAALYPLFLTGTWVGTHQGDVAGVEVTWDPQVITEGDNVTFTGTVQNLGSGALGPLSANLSVGRVFGDRLLADATQGVEIPRLGPGERAAVTLQWTARAGVFWALLDADAGDALPEAEEFNNQKAQPFVVQHRGASAEQAPRAPANLAGDPAANATSDAAIALDPLPTVTPGNATVLRATVTNLGPDPLEARAVVRAGRVFEGAFSFPREASQNVSLAPGATQVVELNWTTQEGSYWVEAFVNLTAGKDPEAANNREARPLTVQPFLNPDLQPPKPPEKVTIKQFYGDILSIQIGVLLPFIALFYAAGAVADEREAGSLPYLLTRPFRRWAIPLAKFGASFLVAAAAVVVGVLLAFALLLGEPQGNAGFLTSPLLIALLGLFAYGAFFTLLGVVVDRPYLVGVAFVIGWERVAANFVPWVQNLTLSQHLNNVVRGLPLDQGAVLLPQGDDPMRALLILVVASVAFLVAAALYMRYRDFDV